MKGLFKQHTLQVPVVSVGNLVLGGTGKTPTVRFIASFLQSNGFSPAIVSRGYGGKAKNQCNIVSNGQDILMSATEAGDEPHLLAKSLSNIPVLTGKKRYIPCRVAVEKFQADVIILDDGFQHLRVKRDLDIVLFDGTYLAGNSRIFPGGPLREPVSALHRCSSFLITGTNSLNNDRAKKFAELLQHRFSDKDVYFSSPSNYTIADLSGAEVASENLGKIVAFCGIANPERFEKVIKHMKINLVSCASFSDHAKYTQKVLNKLTQKAIEEGASGMLTTEKDLVKIKHLTHTLPLYCLHFTPTFSEGFTSHLLTRLQNARDNLKR